MSERSDQLRQQILQLTAEFHAEAFASRDFVPGTSVVPSPARSSMPPT
jgi:CDP-6-deoxy-D-xylo-4-hexulose-3-dehydrase